MFPTMMVTGNKIELGPLVVCIFKELIGRLPFHFVLCLSSKTRRAVCSQRQCKNNWAGRVEILLYMRKMEVPICWAVAKILMGPSLPEKSTRNCLAPPGNNHPRVFWFVKRRSGEPTLLPWCGSVAAWWLLLQK